MLILMMTIVETPFLICGLLAVVLRPSSQGLHSVDNGSLGSGHKHPISSTLLRGSPSYKASGVLVCFKKCCLLSSHFSFLDVTLLPQSLACWHHTHAPPTTPGSFPAFVKF